ncbi:hypothetical protein EJ110_NYTH38847 [Nymphaea thermarum]|nr:hypothetical protein EJ110_NYTH38847 [Nymphaea thermarum]
MGRVGLAWKLLLVTLLVAAGVARAAGRGLAVPEMRGPGFLYTISRGRCTPEYWSSRREAWPKMVPLSSSVSKIFGWQTLERYQPELTLLEATNRNDDNNAFVHLLRESSAALLNSYSRKGFPYPSWKVKSLLLQGLVSQRAATEQASRLSAANQDCD